MQQAFLILGWFKNYQLSIINSSMHPKDLKDQLRQSVKERLARMSQKDKDAESRSLCKRIIKKLPLPPLTVVAFMPMPNEVDIKPVIEHLLTNGYRVGLPRMEHQKLVFRSVAALTDLVPGELFNVPEPKVSAPLLQQNEIDLALVPARAYARNGDRMGRGNGGFDIWIRSQRMANRKTEFWGSSSSVSFSMRYRWRRMMRRWTLL